MTDDEFLEYPKHRRKNRLPIKPALQSLASEGERSNGTESSSCPPDNLRETGPAEVASGDVQREMRGVRQLDGRRGGSDNTLSGEPCEPKGKAKTEAKKIGLYQRGSVAKKENSSQLAAARKKYIAQKHETAKSEEETWTARLKRFAHLFDEFARLADGLEFLLLNGKLQKHTRREKYAVAVKLWRQEISNRHEWVTMAISPIGEKERELRLKGVDAWKKKEEE